MDALTVRSISGIKERLDKGWADTEESSLKNDLPSYREISREIDEIKSKWDPSAPQFEEIAIGRGETVRCLKNGLWLLMDGADPYAVVLSQLQEYGGPGSINGEIAVPPAERGAALCANLFC